MTEFVHYECVIHVPISKMVYNGAPFCEGNFYQCCIKSIKHNLADSLHYVKIMYYGASLRYMFNPWCIMVYLAFSRCFYLLCHSLPPPCDLQHCNDMSSVRKTPTTLSTGWARPGPDHILLTLTLALEGQANLSQPWPRVGLAQVIK